MPHCCCVPYCKGNYASTGRKVAVFGFPQDPELRNRWLHAIEREHFRPTKTSKVCELHFKDELIERKTTFRVESTDEVLEVPLKVPRLAKGAIPSEMLGCPLDMSNNDIPVKTSPESKRMRTEPREIDKAIAESLQTATSFKNSGAFSSLAEANDKLKELEQSMD